jgi:diacylglycerol kinase (ATP)
MMLLFVLEHRDDETLAQEQEIMERVHDAVATAAKTAWNDVQTECTSVIQTARNFALQLFPMFRKDPPHRVWDDALSLVIVLILFVVAFCILALPKNKQEQSTSTTATGATTDSSDDLDDSDTNNNTSYEHQQHGANDMDETDEERFESYWQTLVHTTTDDSPSCRYHRLVLPPTCRLLQVQTHPKKRGGGSTRNRSPIRTAWEENPAKRLSLYARMMFYVVRSLLSFDFVGAGLALMAWLQNVRRLRTTAATHRQEDEAVGINPDTTTTQNQKGPQQPTLTRTKSATVESSDESPLMDSTNFGCALPTADGSEQLTVKSGSSSRKLKPEKSAGDAQSRIDPASGGNNKQDTLPLQNLFEAPNPRQTFSNDDDDNHCSDVFVLDDESSVTSHSSSADDGASLLLKQFGRTSPPRKKDALAAYRKHQSMYNLSGSSTDSTTTQYHNPQHQQPQRKLQTIDSDSSFTRHAQTSCSSETKTNEGPDEYSGDFYFDSETNSDALPQLSVRLADKNGYILGDDLLPDSSYVPLLVFVNSRAGPQQGHLLITQLRRLLNPIQIYDLAKTSPGPQAVLQSFSAFTRLRILVCGGDGTVSWIIGALEKLNLQRKWPPIAILPLGTGNDLARIHGWGGGYHNESLITILEQVSESYISLLDRWELTIEEKNSKKKSTKAFFNYLGVGADAQTALQVHYLRESRPEWFFSRLFNKAWYGVFGAEDILTASSVNVRKEIKLVADGVEIPLPPDSQGIILLNIDSYAGGVPLWSHGKKFCPAEKRARTHVPRRSRSMGAIAMQAALKRGRHGHLDRVESNDDLLAMSKEERYDYITACDRPSSCQDGMLEIVSIRGAFHLGQIKVGLSNAQRLCQCREAVITIKNKVAVQVDGEPWRQRSCTLRVKRKKHHGVMLHRSADDGVETEMSQLLDWAEERRLIDSHVHTILMKEFSRRIESKTRKRRVRGQDNIMHTLKKAISSSAAMNQMTNSQTWHAGISF